MAMSQEAYIASKGVRCPFCGSEEIEGDGVEIDAGFATQEVHCHHCGGAWEDQYQLAGYRVLEDPGSKGDEEAVGEYSEIFHDVGETATSDSATYFAVSGRIPGDYEDTTLTFSLPESANREDAVQAFEAAIYGHRGIDRADVIEQHGEPLYVSAVLQSATSIQSA